MKGYKVFNPNWTCKGFKYEVGKKYHCDGEISCCKNGFHFCTKLADCFNYYKFNSNNKVAEIEASGDIDSEEDDTKHCASDIEIIREITWHEVLDMINEGKDNTGMCNSGDWNSGNWNSGDYNSGNWNSGDYNSGNWNSGDYNSGNGNNGDYNSGNWNSGDYNSGNWNSGDWNKASNSVGCFNTEDRPLFFFDKPTDMTFEQWRSSDAYWLLNRIDFRPADWIWLDEMSDEEKEHHPEAKTTDGYLKIRDNSNCCKEWWNGLSDREKDIIKAIPNFDADIFFECTGIRV